MKAYLYLVILLLFSNKIYSQIEPQKSSELNNQISNTEMISRYRSLIMDNIVANNKEKTKELFNDLKGKFDNEYYTTLYPTEEWIICFWLTDYDRIISGSLKMDSLAFAKIDNKIKPKQDQLYQVLNQTLDKNRDDFTDRIKKSAYSPEDQNFLLIILKTLTTPNDRNYQSAINSSASEFLNQYPHSKYGTYTRNYIRYEYQPKGFSFGMEFYSGVSILNAVTSKYFESGGVFGFGFIWGFGNFQLNTRGAFVFSGLNSNILYNNYTWAKGARAELFIPELSLNYKFILHKRTSISPILGLGWFSAAPYENDKKNNPDLNAIEINANAAPIIGIEISHDYTNQYYYNNFYRRPMFGYYSWNLRYEIQRIPFDNHYSDMNGLMHNISVSFKFGIGGAKRKF